MARKRKDKQQQMMSVDTYQLQQKAGEALIRWLRNSDARDFYFSCDCDEGADVNLRNAQAQGYNEARTELFEAVANLILDKCEDNDLDDDDFDDDDECDCD